MKGFNKSHVFIVLNLIHVCVGVCMSVYIKRKREESATVGYKLKLLLHHHLVLQS